jgi:hypothetical protein
LTLDEHFYLTITYNNILLGLVSEAIVFSAQAMTIYYH